MANSSLQKYILTSALIRLAQHFQDVIDIKQEGQNPRQLVPAFITSNDKYNVYESIRKQQQAKPSGEDLNSTCLPFIGMGLESMNLNRSNTARSPCSSFRLGNNVQVEAGGVYTVIRAVPVEFTCNVMFLTDDFWQMLDFCSQWISGIVDKTFLNFICVFNGIAFTITLDLDENITFPQKDNTLDIVNLYEFTSTLKIRGYINTSLKDFKDSATKMPVRKIVITPAIVPPYYDGITYLNATDYPEAFYIDTGDGKHEILEIDIQ